MSLRVPQPIPPTPDDTVRVARAAFRTRNPYLILRNQLGVLFTDADFADLYPKCGQPSYALWRLALVTLMQFREGLRDRHATDATRARIDWKYLLTLDLAEPDFDHSVVCEFRGRLLGNMAVDRLLDTARENGLLKAPGASASTARTCSPPSVPQPSEVRGRDATCGAEKHRRRHAGLAARARVTRVARALRQAGRGEADAEAGPKRGAYVAELGAGGFSLLDALARTDMPPEAAALPAIKTLRRVWTRHLEQMRDRGCE